MRIFIDVDDKYFGDKLENHADQKWLFGLVSIKNGHFN